MGTYNFRERSLLMDTTTIASWSACAVYIIINIKWRGEEGRRGRGEEGGKEGRQEVICFSTLSLSSESDLPRSYVDPHFCRISPSPPPWMICCVIIFTCLFVLQRTLATTICIVQS